MELVKISELKIHEEIDPMHLEELKKEIITEGFIKDPIIVDRNSNIVLDGHHRLTILKLLGYSKIPVYYVDYLNDSGIGLRTWYPMILGSEKRLMTLLNEAGVIFQNKDTKSCGALVLQDKTIFLDSDRWKVMNMLRGKIKMDYAFTKSLAKKLAQNKKITAAIIFSPLTKKEVIEHALSGHIFPPKTTQHIIPHRPKNWFVTLAKLV